MSIDTKKSLTTSDLSYFDNHDITEEKTDNVSELNLQYQYAFSKTNLFKQHIDVAYEFEKELRKQTNIACKYTIPLSVLSFIGVAFLLVFSIVLLGADNTFIGGILLFSCFPLIGWVVKKTSIGNHFDSLEYRMNKIHNELHFSNEAFNCFMENQKLIRYSYNLWKNLLNKHKVQDLYLTQTPNSPIAKEFNQGRCVFWWSILFGLMRDKICYKDITTNAKELNEQAEILEFLFHPLFGLCNYKNSSIKIKSMELLMNCVFHLEQYHNAGFLASDCHKKALNNGLNGYYTYLLYQYGMNIQVDIDWYSYIPSSIQYYLEGLPSSHDYISSSFYKHTAEEIYSSNECKAFFKNLIALDTSIRSFGEIKNKNPHFNCEINLQDIFKRKHVNLQYLTVEIENYRNKFAESIVNS